MKSLPQPTVVFGPWLMGSACVLLAALLLELRPIASLTALNASLVIGAACAFGKSKYLRLAAEIVGITLATYIKAHAPSVTSYGGTELMLSLTSLLQAAASLFLLWWLAWPRKRT